MMNELDIARIRLAILLLKQYQWDGLGEKLLTEAWMHITVLIVKHPANQFLEIAADSTSGSEHDITLAIESLALITGDVQ